MINPTKTENHTERICQLLVFRWCRPNHSDYTNMLSILWKFILSLELFCITVKQSIQCIKNVVQIANNSRETKIKVKEKYTDLRLA